MKLAAVKHYARSLVEMGAENACLDELTQDLRDADEKINANLDFKKFLLDKQVAFAKKKEALKVVFQDFISGRTYNFLFLLIKNNKLPQLGEILALSGKLALEVKDVAEILIESVVPITPEQEKTLAAVAAEKLGRTVVVKNIINEKILGGLKLRFKDTIIDSSIFGKISRLKEKIESFEQ